MWFKEKLVCGRLIKRHSRFLADVELEDGEKLTAHTSNTGSMAGCCDPGNRVWLSRASNPKRKYAFTWEIIEVGPDSLVGINTLKANHLVKEAIENGTVTELQGYDEIASEVKYGTENSRIDFLLRKVSDNQEVGLCYVEVKNVTLVENEIAYFPDAVSARGAKHLRELQEMVKQGNRAVIFFCIQRSDAKEFRPAENIDSKYAETLRVAIDAGVEALAYYAVVSSEEIALVKPVPIVV